MEERITSATLKQEWVLNQLARGDYCLVELSSIAQAQGINTRKSSAEEWAGAPLRQLRAMGLAVKLTRKSYFGRQVYSLTAKGRAWARAMGTALAA